MNKDVDNNEDDVNDKKIDFEEYNFKLDISENQSQEQLPEEQNREFRKKLNYEYYLDRVEDFDNAAKEYISNHFLNIRVGNIFDFIEQLQD